jgi:hypothetical protein
MPATSFAHAVLSAAAVGLLLSTLRRAGPRAGGLAAAVPISSVPALFWLSLEHGGGYAASAVLGSLWGTGLTVLPRRELRAHGAGRCTRRWRECSPGWRSRAWSR